jgi:hypothetical protein
MSRDSVIGIAIGYGPEGRGGEFESWPSRQVLEPTHPPIERLSGAQSSRVKWQGRQSDHSPPNIAEVNKT